jgi:hypothetical protein
VPDLHLLVTCTKRKTRPPLPTLMLRSVAGETIGERAGNWLGRLRANRAETTPVECLYAGDPWRVVCSLAGTAVGRGIRVRVWVCSAGYGLLAWDSRVAPYAATFTPGQPDSVGPNDRAGDATSAVQTWWELLAGWEGPARGTPRSVTDLVRTFPRSYFLVAVSPPYLTALGADLRKAVEGLPDRDRFAVLSAGAQARDGLAEHLVPGGAQLQPLVGGARASLNVRLARLALQEWGADEPRLSVLRAHFGRLLRQQPRRPRSPRTPITDEQVKAYIREALRQDARQRPTPLLARLRTQSRACEQSRFVSLFRQVEEEGYGA